MKDKNLQEKIETILYAYGVKESGACAEEICTFVDECLDDNEIFDALNWGEQFGSIQCSD